MVETALHGDPVRHHRARAVRQSRRPRRRQRGAPEDPEGARPQGHHRDAALPRVRGGRSAPRAAPHAALARAGRQDARGHRLRRPPAVAGRPRPPRRPRSLRPRRRLRRPERGLPGQRDALRRPLARRRRDRQAARRERLAARPRARQRLADRARQQVLEGPRRADAVAPHDPQRRAPGHLPARSMLLATSASRRPTSTSAASSSTAS